MGFAEAQNENLKLIDSFKELTLTPGEEVNIEQLRDEISQNIIHGQTFLRNFKKFYPDIYVEVATRKAVQTLLNDEKEKIERLLKSGRIDIDEARKMVEGVEERMKKIHKYRRRKSKS
jgi:leucyl aminopeptidase